MTSFGSQFVNASLFQNGLGNRLTNFSAGFPNNILRMIYVKYLMGMNAVNDNTTSDAQRQQMGL
jgi:hypothetical protein